MPSLAVELKDSTASATVPPTGGSVTLPRFATVTFPAGAFAASQAVTVAATSTPLVRKDYFRSLPSSAGPPLPYDIRINTGGAAPATPFEVVFVLPDQFLQSIPQGHQVRVFAQMLEFSEMHAHDDFILFDSHFDPITKTVRAQLPNEAFADARRTDNAFEAIVIVGSTP